MSNSTSTTALTILLGLTLTSSAFACGGGVGWESPAASAPVLTIEQAIAKSKAELGVKVEKSRIQAKCGDSNDFTVTDLASGKYLASVPVPYAAESANDGRFLLARTKQLLKTPVAQLLELNETREKFYEDTDGLKADLGLSAYVPNALAFEDRTKNEGQDYLVYVTLDEHCDGRGSMSPANVSRQAYIKTLEYVPGRSDYSKGTIYQSGDIRKAILGNTEVMTEVKKMVAENVKYCRQDNEGYKRPWRDVSAKLRTESAELLQKRAFERFSAINGQPVEAFMTHARFITVRFKDSTNQPAGLFALTDREFADNVSEIMKIQQAVEKAGVKIDKRSKLSIIGLWQLDRKELPATLRE